MTEEEQNEYDRIKRYIQYLEDRLLDWHIAFNKYEHWCKSNDSENEIK